MADPTKYTPGYSYSGFESANPTAPKPGAELDDDFANISQSIDEIVDAVRNVRRSDGALANGIVGPDQLASSLVIGFTLQGAWTSGTSYSGGDGTVYDGAFYKARFAHVASNANRPDVSPSTWTFLVTVAAISVTDGSITAAKLDASDAANIRIVVGQAALVNEALAATSAKTTPVNADTFAIADSAASGVLKLLSWANLKTAIFTALGALIAGGTGKSTPVNADTLALSDSADTNATKKLSWADLKSTLNDYFNKLGGVVVVAGDILYGSANGTLSRLAKGTDGQALVLASGVPAWASASAKPAMTFRPAQNEPPSSNYAVFGVRNAHPYLAFDTTTQWSAFFTGVLPNGYAGGGLTVTVFVMMASATSGTVGFDAAFERMEASSLDLDSDSFATAKTITATTVPGTSGQILALSVAFSNTEIDGLVAGESFRLRIRRDVANDTAAGDAQVTAVQVREP